MDAVLVGQFLLACDTARQMRSKMPKLPKGILPRQVHIIEAIHVLKEHQDTVRVGDVAHFMHGTAPSITKLLADLCARGYVEKQQQPDDHRIFTVRLTESGEKFYDFYCHQMYHWLADRMQDLDSTKVEIAIDVIRRFAREIGATAKEFPKEASQNGTI
jgi:DNA-binding MarR family transcriptional regulator